MLMRRRASLVRVGGLEISRCHSVRLRYFMDTYENSFHDNLNSFESLLGLNWIHLAWQPLHTFTRASPTAMAHTHLANEVREAASPGAWSGSSESPGETTSFSLQVWPAGALQSCHFPPGSSPRIRAKLGWVFAPTPLHLGPKPDPAAFQEQKVFI